jgi:sulfur-oxidizing protein SoxY
MKESAPTEHPGRSATRREVLGAAAAIVAGCAVPSIAVRPAAATPVEMRAAIARIVGGGKLNAGRVKLEIPPLVENGNTVSCMVAVESPMTAADHVRAIHLFNEKNPQPHVISARLGPRAGRAGLSTRIRLNDSQTVIAIAEMSDGSFWSASADVIVTIAACLEDPI